MKNFFKKYFRKDNMKFVFEFSISVFGYIISNISLISMDNHWNPAFILGIFTLLVCLSFLVVSIYYRYDYYHGLAKHLQANDDHLFLICSYIAKSHMIRNHNKTNKFTISHMDIIYEIYDVPSVFDADKSHIDFTVTYDVTAKNINTPCSKIYYVSLSSGKNKEAPLYKIENENWSKMDADLSLISDRNLDLWYGIKSGDSIPANKTFKYKIKSVYKNSYNLLEKNRFLISPQNYGRTVNEINLIVRSKSAELGKLIDTPRYTEYYNGLNVNDRNGNHRLKESKEDEYKTYYETTLHPQANDTIYVMELFRKE